MHARNTYIRIIFLTITMFLCVLSWGQNPKGGRVTATADPTIICAGESSQLHAEAVTSTIIDFETGNFSQYDFENNTTYPWTVVTADNGSSYCMKSGNGGVNSSTSTISAEVTFATLGVVSFDAKCMGEGSYTSYDKCIFSIDGQQQFAYGAQVSGWQNYSYIVSAGTHTFTWSYSKDGSISPTGDAFFVDNISFNDNVEYSELVVNFETGNFSQANFNNTSSGSNYPWIITNSTAATGSYCMMSGNKGIASSSSAISLTHVFESPGYISFEAKCMGEGTSYDVCTFYIDGVKQFEKGANGDSWGSYFYSITNGSHTFKWQYTKDYSVNPTGDAFYVDNIALVAVDPNSGGSSSEATFLWQPGNMSGPDPTVSPAQTTTYTVTASNEQGVIGTAQVTVIVDPLPELSIEPENPSICLEDTITLYARVNVPDCPRPGDILCNNGSVVHPDEWTTSMGAQGVVFYVDDTGQHGWAIDLGQIQQNGKIKWSTESKTISGLQPYSNWTEAIVDVDGYTNTQIIRDFGDASKYPAAWAVNFNQGWYLPAIGQLNFLFSELVAVNASLEQVAGQNAKIIIKDTKEIWSSTACSDNTYVMRLWTRLGRLGFDKKTNTNYVRSVKNF